MTLQDICDRCSRFAGWKLTVRVKDGQIEFSDPDQTGQSWLFVRLSPSGFSLVEVYGRMKHWAITVEEQAVMKAVLTKASE
jgi:hypothetical protein